jgi:hypothetical protein
MKLLTEYESVTQKVLLPLESLLQNAKQLRHAQFYFAVSGLKGHGNPDSNLESRFTFSRQPYKKKSPSMFNETCSMAILVLIACKR